jgi:hypothetical protein
VTHDDEKRRYDAWQTSRLRHRETAILLTASKANISLEVASGLVRRRAAVGVGTLHNRADRRPTDPHAPVAQSLNLL